jgi:propanol-preferring alcohol dehydrogenase
LLKFLLVGGGLVRAGLKAGEAVAIVGAGGGLGHLGIQFAKALGLRVIAIDARDEALQLAKECGADAVVDARNGKEKVVEEVKKVTAGEGAHATLNVSDHETAAATSASVTKMHGILVQIAQPENVIVPFQELVFRDIRIHGSLCGKSFLSIGSSTLRIPRLPGRGPEDA